MMKINVDACSYRISDHSVFTQFFNHVGEHKTTKYEETDDCGSTTVTDDPYSKKTFKLLSWITKRSEIYTKTAKLYKKDVAVQKETAWKSYEIQGGGPKVAVMVG